MKKNYTYYKGVFNSQFSFPGKAKSNSKIESKLKIDFFNLEIEDKKELIKAEKISESEFLSLQGCSQDPLTCTCFLHNSGKSFPLTRNETSYLEVLEKRTKKERRKEYDQLTLVFYKDASNFVNSNQDFFSSTARHGKLSALALVRVFEEIIEEPKELSVIEEEVVVEGVKVKVDEPKPLSPSGCFSGFTGGNTLGGGVSGTVGNNPQSGCFGGGTALPGVFPGLGGGSAGCFGGGVGLGLPNLGGNGCFNFGVNGCFSLGGLWQLLRLFLFLGLLLYLLSQIRSCDSAAQKDNVVYVYDTIQMVKYDTVKIIEESKIKITTINNISLPNVQFKTNSDELLEGSLADIQSLAEFLVSNDSVTAVIEGHTDDIGNPEENMKLSKARSESVKKLLVKLGIEESRITAEGYGDTRPKAIVKGSNPPRPDTTLEGRLINRRVEVKLESLDTTTKTETSKQ